MVNQKTIGIFIGLKIVEGLGIVAILFLCYFVGSFVDNNTPLLCPNMDGDFPCDEDIFTRVGIGILSILGVILIIILLVVTTIVPLIKINLRWAKDIEETWRR